jgi:hypothetical protein
MLNKELKNLQDNIVNEDLKKLQDKYKYDIQVMRIKMLIQEDKYEQEIEMFKIKHNNEIKQLCEKFKINID